eukprot:1452364-Amphidinium_carterae.1
MLISGHFPQVAAPSVPRIACLSAARSVFAWHCAKLLMQEYGSEEGEHTPEESGVIEWAECNITFVSDMLDSP